MSLRLSILTILLLTLTSQIALAGTKYQIINETTLRNIKRSLDVRLPERVTKTELRRIALELKARDSRLYANTFIVYFVKDMPMDAGGWAATHFTPKLDIQIFGMTRKEFSSLNAQPKGKAVLGSWVESGTAAGMITIERGSKSLVFHKTYPDGSRSTKPLKESGNLSPGVKLHYVKDVSFGDHLRISKAGDLEYWDNDGIFATAKKQ